MLRPAPPHEVPVGPLAVRWLGYDVPSLRAGTTAVGAVELQNAGSATWRSHADQGVHLAYHWLDLRGNPIIWDSIRTPFQGPITPGEQTRVAPKLVAPIPPGSYRLAFDLVHEHRFWFAEIGNAPLEVTVEVMPRLAERSLRVEIHGGEAELAAVTEAALSAQDEPVSEVGEATAYLAAGCIPARDWSRRILDAHEEGFIAVGGSIDVQGGRLARRRLKELAPWRPGFGRVPDWSHPLLCPSLLVHSPIIEFAGLPAIEPASIDGPYVCDGRVRVELPGGRRRA